MIRRLIWAGVIVVVLAVHTFVTDRETKPAEKRAGGKVIDLPGGDLFYRDEGDRGDRVVVLIHGFACSERWWNRVAPDLVQHGFRVIRFDLLGHGASEKPRSGYAPGEQADRLALALRRIGVRRFSLVGHSLGGTVAVALTQQHPRLVRKVAVIGTPPRDGYAHLPLTSRVATWPVIGELSRRLAPDKVIKAGLDSAFADRVDVPDMFVDDLDGMTFTAYDDSLTDATDWVKAEPNTERIKRTGKPLLVIFGAKDEIVDPKAADRWAKDVPRAKVVKLPGAGHSTMWDTPRETARQLVDFLR